MRTGILAAIEHIVMDELGCAAEDISIVIGDTAKCRSQAPPQHPAAQAWCGTRSSV